MTPADDIVTPTAPRPARSPTRRKRTATPKRNAPAPPSPVKRATSKPGQKSKGIWASPRRKLAEGAEQAASDAGFGAITLYAIYFATTLVMLALIGLDAVAGTSFSTASEGWILAVTALWSAVVWGLLLQGPATLLAWCLRRSSGAPRDPMLSKPRVRPFLNAIAVYMAMLVGVAVLNMPMPPRPPLEFTVPRTDVYGAELAILDLKLMALRCIQDPTPPHCSRQDIRFLQANFFLQWLAEHPATFEGRHGWG